MGQARSQVPEVGHELGRLAEIGSAEPRDAPVLVHMDVKHAGVAGQRKLHRSPHCVGIEKTSISLVIHVPIVLKRHVRVCQDQDAITATAQLAADETGPLRRKRMRPAQIGNGLIQHSRGELEVDVHRSAFKCCAKTSIGRPLGT